MSFVDEVKAEADPNLCKIGNFLAKQNPEAFKKANKELLTDEELVKAKVNFPQSAVLGALRKRGLVTTDDTLRKHVTKSCACFAGEVIV